MWQIKKPWTLNLEPWEENLLFRFVSVPPLVQGPAVPTFSKKEQFPFPPGSQVHGTTVCDALPPHSRPRPILPVAKRVRFGDDIPPHAPLASPVRDPGSSVRMPQNAPPSVPSTPTPFRCTTTGYVPKVPTTPFRDQVVNLQALPSEEADPALALLCPVRALRIYVTHTRSVRSSEQLFVCHGGQQKGKAVSKQRLAHWIVEAVALAYQSQGEPCPLGVRAHSTRSVASSHALAHGASLADICRAAGWATPNTFARFYNLRVEPVSSRVLGK